MTAPAPATRFRMTERMVACVVGAPRTAPKPNFTMSRSPSAIRRKPCAEFKAFADGSKLFAEQERPHALGGGVRTNRRSLNLRRSISASTCPLLSRRKMIKLRSSSLPMNTSFATGCNTLTEPPACVA